jgi:hypothetical protein
VNVTFVPYLGDYLTSTSEISSELDDMVSLISRYGIHDSSLSDIDYFAQVAGLVNFKKCRLIGEILEDITTKQTKNCDVDVCAIPCLLTWLHDLITHVKTLKRVDLSELKEHFHGLSRSLITQFAIRVSDENVFSRGNPKQIEVSLLLF